MTQPVRYGSPKRTSISVYVEDADWLRSLQREISFKRNTFIAMHDLMHEIVANAKEDEKEQGESA